MAAETCAICLEEVSGGLLQLCDNGDCTAAYCEDCVKGYLSSTISSAYEGACPPIRCPGCTFVVRQPVWAQYCPPEGLQKHRTLAASLLSIQCGGCHTRKTMFYRGALTNVDQELLRTISDTSGTHFSLIGQTEPLRPPPSAAALAAAASAEGHAEEKQSQPENHNDNDNDDGNDIQEDTVEEETSSLGALVGGLFKSMGKKSKSKKNKNKKAATATATTTATTRSSGIFDSLPNVLRSVLSGNDDPLRSACRLERLLFKYNVGMRSLEDTHKRLQDLVPIFREQQSAERDAMLRAVLLCLPDEERRANLHLRLIREHPRVITTCCTRVHCFRCKTQNFHEGQTCEAVQLARGDQQELAFCPSCGIALVKGDGCNSINCVCGHNFSWTERVERTRRALQFESAYPQDTADACVHVLCDTVRELPAPHAQAQAQAQGQAQTQTQTQQQAEQPPSLSAHRTNAADWMDINRNQVENALVQWWGTHYTTLVKRPPRLPPKPTGTAAMVAAKTLPRPHTTGRQQQTHVVQDIFADPGEVAGVLRVDLPDIEPLVDMSWFDDDNARNTRTGTAPRVPLFDSRIHGNLHLLGALTVQTATARSMYSKRSRSGVNEHRVRAAELWMNRHGVEKTHDTTVLANAVSIEHHPTTACLPVDSESTLRALAAFCSYSEGDNSGSEEDTMDVDVDALRTHITISRARTLRATYRGHHDSTQNTSIASRTRIMGACQQQQQQKDEEPDFGPMPICPDVSELSAVRPLALSCLVMQRERLAALTQALILHGHTSVRNFKLRGQRCIPQSETQARDDALAGMLRTFEEFQSEELQRNPHRAHLKKAKKCVRFMTEDTPLLERLSDDTPEQKEPTKKNEAMVPLSVEEIDALCEAVPELARLRTLVRQPVFVAPVSFQRNAPSDTRAPTAAAGATATTASQPLPPNTDSTVPLATKLRAATATLLAMALGRVRSQGADVDVDLEGLDDLEEHGVACRIKAGSDVDTTVWERIASEAHLSLYAPLRTARGVNALYGSGDDNASKTAADTTASNGPKTLLDMLCAPQPQLRSSASVMLQQQQQQQQPQLSRAEDPAAQAAREAAIRLDTQTRLEALELRRNQLQQLPEVHDRDVALQLLEREVQRLQVLSLEMLQDSLPTSGPEPQMWVPETQRWAARNPPPSLPVPGSGTAAAHPHTADPFSGFSYDHSPLPHNPVPFPSSMPQPRPADDPFEDFLFQQQGPPPAPPRFVRQIS